MDKYRHNKSDDSYNNAAYNDAAYNDAASNNAAYNDAAYNDAPHNNDFYSDDPDVIERRAREYERRYSGYREAYDNYGYQGAEPVTAGGKPMKNRFGLKLTLAIIFTLLAAPLGIAAIVFTALQNSAYRKKEWDSFRLFRILSNIFLVLGGIISVLAAFFLGVVIWVMVMASRDGELLESMKQYMLEDQEMQMLVEEILGEDGMKSAQGLIDRMENPLNEDTELFAPDDIWNLPEIDVPGMYEMEINDYTLNVPMRLEDFLQIAGEEVDGDLSEWEMEDGEGEVETVSGRFYLYIWDMNGNDELDMEDIVEGFDYQVLADDSFSWVGLNRDSELAEILAVFGDDYDITDLTEFDLGEQYYWMTEAGWIVVFMAGDRIDAVSILNMDY